MVVDEILVGSFICTIFALLWGFTIDDEVTSMSMGITVYDSKDVQKRNSPSLLALWSKFEWSQTTLPKLRLDEVFFGFKSCPLAQRWRVYF